MEIYRIVVEKSERELTVKGLAGLCQATCWFFITAMFFAPVPTSN